MTHKYSADTRRRTERRRVDVCEFLFKVGQPTGGGLLDPPKLWVDIHDRTPKPPETIRIRTGNKTRIKRGKIDNE